MTNKKSLFRAAAGMFAALTCIATAATTAQATPNWPAKDKAVTLVVPFPAGSGSDTLARMLAREVTQQTGASVIVENKPGGGTIIGAQQVAKSPNDGYTLLYTIVVTHTQNPHLFEKLSYDPFKDFTPIIQAVRSATVLEANKDAPFSTTKELVEYAKANPGKVNFGSFSMGSTSHLNGEILKRAAGIDIVHVPYKGTADASRALLAGEVQIYFDGTATAVEKWRAGQVKLLGPATDKRLSVLPDLPTLEEQGIPGLNIVGWQGIFAPGNTPPELAEQIATVFRNALNTPQVIDYIVKGGNEVSGAGPQEYARIVRSDYERWGEVIRAAGIRLQ
jgi:tripartite-type tricarboxylate transporter receptor subunit TctC